MLSRRYGSPDVLQFEETAKPVPTDNQVLIKVYASSVNAYDWHMLRADPFIVRLMGGGLIKPKIQILGADVAGRVEAVGRNVKQFKPGDGVFGDLTSSGCGGFAEYVCAREDAIVPMPQSATFEESAAVPLAAMTALQALRNNGHIQQGQQVLIEGASGGVGTFAVQIAKAFDTEVTAVCSTRNVELAHSLGADHVIDYTKEDFARSERRFDLIFAANGYHSLFEYKRALKDNGTFVMSGGSGPLSLQTVLFGRLISATGNKKMGMMLTHLNKQDLIFLKDLVDAGKIKPVIDRTYKLSDVPDAIRYLEEGHARGKVVIEVESDS